jgi:hypothetical protein
MEIYSKNGRKKHAAAFCEVADIELMITVERLTPLDELLR